MYIIICICLCICICLHVYVCIYVYMHVYVYLFICIIEEVFYSTHMKTFFIALTLYVCLYVLYVYLYDCMYVCIYVCMDSMYFSPKLGCDKKFNRCWNIKFLYTNRTIGALCLCKYVYI